MLLAFKLGSKEAAPAPEQGRWAAPREVAPLPQGPPWEQAVLLWMKML